MSTSEKRRRTAGVMVRLLPREHQALTAAAEARGVSMGVLIRERLADVIRTPDTNPAILIAPRATQTPATGHGDEGKQ